MIDTHLAVGRWRLRGGHPDPLCWGNGGLLGGPLAVHLAVLFLLSAAATEALRQAADAQDGQDDQEDDDKDPGVRNHHHHPDSPGYPYCTSLPPFTHTNPQGRKPSPVRTRPLGGLCPEELALDSPHGAREELILLAAVVTAALESFRAGAGVGADRSCWYQGCGAEGSQPPQNASIYSGHKPHS